MSKSALGTDYPRSILGVEDACLQLNSLTIPIGSIAGIQEMVSEVSLGPVLCPPGVTHSELERCRQGFDSLLQKEVKAFISAEFYGGLYALSNGLGTQLGSGVAVRIALEGMGDSRVGRAYEISGAEMESRSGQSDLVSAISASLSISNGSKSSHGHRQSSLARQPIPLPFSPSDGEDDAPIVRHGWFGSHLRPLLSVTAYAQVIKHLAVLLNDAILEKLLSLHFNEWGALLFHQEVSQTMDILDSAAAEVDDSVRISMLKVSWALKILTLDQPGDIRRYRLPLDVIDDSTVRAVMSRRVDSGFSAAAIIGVKFSDIYTSSSFVK